MDKKRFNLWLENNEIEKLKREAKKEKLSVNSYIKNRMLSEIQKTPNLYFNNWWDSPTEINEFLEKLKEKRK